MKGWKEKDVMDDTSNWRRRRLRGDSCGFHGYRNQSFPDQQSHQRNPLTALTPCASCKGPNHDKERREERAEASPPLPPALSVSFNCVR